MQIFIFCTCAVIQVYVTNEQLGLVLVLAGATCEMAIHDHRLSWLYSAVISGQIVISPYMGYKADEIGRRKMLLITLILSVLCSLLSAFRQVSPRYCWPSSCTTESPTITHSPAGVCWFCSICCLASLALSRYFCCQRVPNITWPSMSRKRPWPWQGQGQGCDPLQSGCGVCHAAATAREKDPSKCLGPAVV
ncbi:uncharacterized protein LOC117587084 [Drosophila guanche]|uniref:uncharacterized protein LOC117587084 n=1 Tax=Drosophila guanche TaxID=7266 RepID=UPI001471A2C1|nr:uncharacterized protein LOC117587084 [Drosophila guanche]